MVSPGGGWRKCTGCGKVKIVEMFQTASAVCLKCEQYPAQARRNSVSATARYRERTGGAYDKAYNKAVRLATARLKEAHPVEWDQLLGEARGEVGI